MANKIRKVGLLEVLGEYFILDKNRYTKGCPLILCAFRYCGVKIQSIDCW